MFKANSLKHLIIHIVIILILFIGIIWCFFFVYLPSTTSHGETIIVPKVTGMNIAEIEALLSSKNLNYQINDSSYSAGVKPFTVLDQNPAEGSQVKKNRKIYLSISAKNPPKVKMPKLVEMSLKSAEITLKSYDLKLGDVKYVSSPYPNLVLDQLVEDDPIAAGAYLSKGTTINLLVGDGNGKEEDVDSLEYKSPEL